VLVAQGSIAHYDGDVAVISPLDGWSFCDDAVTPDDEVGVAFGTDKGAQELPALVRRWPTRPKAQITITDFGTPHEVKRRRFVRVSVKQRVVMSTPGVENAFDHVSGETADLSAGGARIVLPGAVEPAERFAIVIELDRQSPFVAVGRPVVVEPHPNGRFTIVRMEFMQAPPRETDRLARWTVQRDFSNRADEAKKGDRQS